MPGERKRLEELCWRGDGTTFWVETIKTPLRDPEGRIIGTVGIARDVTERMQVEREREARQGVRGEDGEGQPRGDLTGGANDPVVDLSNNTATMLMAVPGSRSQMARAASAS